MPIPVTEPRSPGWWMKRLFDMLSNRDRQRRLQMLMDYHRGHAPLPEGAENARSAYEAFQKKARSNFAELIVSAMSERMQPVGFRTALDDDATGDAEVGLLWKRTGLDVHSADVHDLMLALGEAFVIVGPVDDETDAPLVTCEDPRYMVGEADPTNPRRLLAALKVLHDDAEGEDRAYLYLPGAIHVAVKKIKKYDAANANTLGRRNGVPFAFDPRGWEWSADRSGALEHSRLPVVKFGNKYGMGEFEAHLDLLGRINHQILQRMIIATLQAFRQRAIKGLPLTYPDDHPSAGEEIDYSAVFSADPAALWQLPETAEMWESQQVDLRPILEAVKDDLEHLASVTRTPMHLLSPAGVNQSAEGASLSREGLVFKVEDRITRTSYPWSQVMSLVLIHDGQKDRSDLAKLDTIWAPAQRLSLTERASAAAQLKEMLPRRTLLIKVLGMSPAEADRTMTEIADEELKLAQKQAAALAAETAAAAQVAAAKPPIAGGAVPGQAVAKPAAAPAAAAASAGAGTAKGTPGVPRVPGKPGRPGHSGQPGKPGVSGKPA